SFPRPPLAHAVIPPPPIALKLLSPTSDFTTSPHSAVLSAMLAFSVMIPPDDSPFPVLDLSAKAPPSKAIHLLIASLLLLVESELLFGPTSGLSPAPLTGFSTS
ncbi:hypothetical protein PanWU01x14_045310, partial [Parasponia andersonii]